VTGYRRNPLLPLILLLTLVVGCGSDDTRVAVRPVVALDGSSRPAGAPLKVYYEWQVSDVATLSNLGDLHVYSHFMDEAGRILWQDDHHPPVPTSQWQTSSIVEYHRTHFIPENVPPGPALLSVGLYDPNGTVEKIPLGHQLTRLEVEPVERLPIIIFDEGWYNPENRPGKKNGQSYRWSRGESVCWLEAPALPCSLYLEASALASDLEGGQTVTLELEGTVLDIFRLTENHWDLRVIPIPGEMVQGRSCLRLVIRTEQVVQREERELGLRVRRLTLF